MNEPRLRFKADDGSQFPDWEEKKFANLYRKNVEKNVNLKFDSSKTISIASMQFNEKGNGASEDSLSSYKVLRLGDIAFEGHENKEYSHGRFVLNDIGDGIMSPRFSCMRPVCTQVDGFWKYYIHSERVMRNILVRSTKKGTMMHELVIPDFLKQSIMVPSLPEQQKIADFLSTIDIVIEKQRETVSAWEERKKGVMQKLFSQEVRFKADDGSDFPEWEDGRLGELCSYRRGSFPQPYGAEEWYDEKNGKPFIQVADVGDNMKLLPDTKRHISKAAMPMSVFVDAGTLIVTLQGSIGRIAITDYDAYIDRTLLIIQNIDSRLKKEFIQYALFVLFADEKKRADGGTIKTITKETLTNFTFKFPCLAEQQKFADCLSSLNEVIEKQKATLAAWEELKKGLLQQMFV